MPWCEPCSRFYNPTSMNADGTCPTCGTHLADPADPADPAESVKAPWHFKLLLVAVVLYLGWRAFQLGDWLVNRF